MAYFRAVRQSTFLCRGTGAQLRKIHQSLVYRVSAHDATFEDAKNRLNTLKEEPGNDVKLQVYALFKQATKGKCDASKPSALDFVGKAKWEAWNALGNMSQDDAQQKYIQLVNKLAASEELVTPSTQAAKTDSYPGLQVTKENKVLRILLNRPDKKNAFTMQMYNGITEVLGEASGDKTIVVAVITGAGNYYSSGNDLANFTNVTPDQIPQMAQKGKVVLQNYVKSLIDFPKPLIALVNGPAVGASVTVLGLFDAVFCTDKATFHTPFTQLGQSPEGCSTYIFPKIMGQAKAGEMLLFNKKITAQEAQERNLVTRVFPEDVFKKETDALVAYYSTLPPKSLQFSKILTRFSERDLLHRVNETESDRLVERWQSEECINAIMSFFSRQKSSL